jgi:hypothetical protein
MELGQAVPQPTAEDAFTAAANPVSRTPAESKAAAEHTSLSSRSTYTRRPGDQGDIDGTPTALAAGSTHDPINEDAPPADTIEGEQMRVLDEDHIMHAQEHKTGTGGDAQSFTQDLDRKLAEQRPGREAIGQQRKEAFDAGGQLGQTGGPALVEGR